MMKWGNICRICSSPADYNIFAKIPTYLHASTNECLNFQKPINIFLEETTGLKNSPDDGLPSFICALCISYLKHAVTFREQCVKNALSLKLIEHYQQNTSESDADKKSALFTPDQLNYVEQRPVHNLLLNKKTDKLDRSNKVHKKLLNRTVPKEGNNESRTRYLNDLFNKPRNASQQVRSNLPSTSAGSGSGNGTGEEEDYPAVTSSDDNEENALLRKGKNCYNYSEINFEEDDPMDQAQLRAIKVNIPEPMWKERKCPACSKRFMHEDSHQLHLENCVEFQFVNFVSELNRLMEIRRQKMVSPHEFVRRMIFVLHKTCTWLHEHSIDSELVEKLNQMKLTNGKIDKTERSKPSIEKPADNSDSCWNSFLTKSNDDSLFSNSLIKLKRELSTPITAENNVLYAIERSESRNSHNTPHLVVQKPIPIRCTGSTTAAGAAALPLHKERARATFLEKLQRATVTPQQPPPFAAAPTTVKVLPLLAVRCTQCNLVVENVSELEIHNAAYHNGHSNTTNTGNTTDEDAQRRRIIALFEDDI